MSVSPRTPPPGETGPDPAMARILRVLVDGRPYMMGELARRALLADARVIVLVDRLVTAGWATRMSDPIDHRRVLVRVTEHGRHGYQRFTEPGAGAGRRRPEGGVDDVAAR